MRRLLALVFLCVAMSTAVALEPDERLDDPVLEARARDLSAELRCMVCQNQSIDESNAPLARDLRLLVRERLVAGDSDEEVVAYLVDRYGEFILLRPRFSARNWLLWAAPLLGLAIGGVVVVFALRRRRRGGGAPPQPLSDEEDRRLAELLGQHGAVPANRSANQSDRPA